MILLPQIIKYRDYRVQHCALAWVLYNSALFAVALGGASGDIGEFELSVAENDLELLIFPNWSLQL